MLEVLTPLSWMVMMMNNLMQQLQSMLGQSTKKNNEGGSGLSKMLVPGALGGLAGLLVGSKSSRKLLSKYGSSALLAGGGAVLGTVLWNKYKDRIRQNDRSGSQYGQPAAPVDQRIQRLIMALVFAAKSDGHIDAKERKIIEQNMQEAGIDEQGERLVQQAIDRPLDPHLVANGVQNEEEALELYFLSCAVIDIDHFMERSYLTALGDALNIPQDVRQSIEQDIQQQKSTITD
jgi:uncharacterized membrane protein YebE (DUF533 family)